MDEFLIAKLESLFNRSFISPYAAARYLLFGGYFTMLYVTRHSLMAINPFVILGFFIATHVMYTLVRRTYGIEAFNSRGYDNTEKKNQQHLRVISIFLLLPIITIPGIDIDIRAIVFYCLFLWTCYHYLTALNWMRPLWHQRWLGMRILNKSRNNYRLRRKKN